MNLDTGARGIFQIEPSNWHAWAHEAGVSPTWTPEHQTAVARFKMRQYLNAFGGNYRDVAIAWYAGPGAVRWPQWKLDRRQGRYPSVNAYADAVMAKACL